MPLLMTELIFGDINTISIPTDAIFIVSLLILIAFLGYIFNNILSSERKQLTQKADYDSNLELIKNKLEDHFPLDATTQDPKNVKKSSVKKINFLPPTTSWKVSSFAVAAIGGASLLGLQHLQKSYEGVQTNQVNIRLDNQSRKSPFSMVDMKTLNQTKIKKISYISPYLQTIKSSPNNLFYQVKDKKIETNFSF
tara:strand:- start:4213 stop:4797 length:585 start_codon:yes stop_codon:yes gene_type:complete